jgi:large subunit ribosomal protein L35Ae
MAKESKSETKSSGKGLVLQFRRGKQHYHPRHFILDLGCKTKEDAQKLVGKEVRWTSPAGKVLVGKVSASHGNKGMVRAIFEHGLPGQAIATEIEFK